MNRTERISSATAWRSVAMPAWNGLARTRRRYWVGLRALLWCICIRVLARPRHWGRSAVRLGALFASCFPLFPRTARARVKVMRRAHPCARLGVVGVGWVGVWGRLDRTAQRTSWCLGSSWVGPRLASLLPRAVARPRLPITHSCPFAPVRRPDLEHAFVFFTFSFPLMWRCPAQRVPMPPSSCACSL